ncbi:hypothetical protein HAX54_030923, partial [Datura stramonium]|nr:hypothetical protein [Datura stramonium]
MVHGILQFTPSIAFCYILHRCESRDIRCRESFLFKKKYRPSRAHRGRGGRGRLSIKYSLVLFASGFVNHPARTRACTGYGRDTHGGEMKHPALRGSLSVYT